MEGAIRPKDSEPERTMLPTYLRTNERSEQGRELKRKRVQIGRPEGQAAAARAVADSAATRRLQGTVAMDQHIMSLLAANTFLVRTAYK